MRERFDSYKAILDRHQKGNASKFIESFDELTPNDRVYLVARVSGRERKANLPDQDANLHHAVAPVAAEVVGGCQVQISGFDPYWLRQAAREARKLGATVILAESTDRFIRNPLFHSVLRSDWQASNEQLEELARCTGGMRLMTHLHPDASPAEVRSYQRKRGQKFKRNKGGRPSPGSTKRRRMRLKLPVIRLLKQGLGNREICRRLDLPQSQESDIRRWRIRYRKYWAAPFLATGR